MTEPLDVATQAALCTQLAAAPALAPISMPLVTYTPTKGVSYLDAHTVMRAPPEHVGIAFTDSNINRGIFQVDAVVPDGQGEAPGLRLAALVAARFAIGTVLLAVGRRLQINSVPHIAAAVKDAPWIRFPVSIRFQVVN